MGKCIPYRPDVDCFRAHYQRGSGGAYPVFRGTPYQPGYGIGSVLSGAFKNILPVLKRTGAAAAKTLLKTGSEVLSDVLEGKNIKSSLKERGIAGLKQVGRHVTGEIAQTLGGNVEGVQQQTGGKRRRRRRVVSFTTEEEPVGNKRTKRIRPVRMRRLRGGDNTEKQRGGFFDIA